MEFLTPEDASAALYLEGRTFEGSILKVRRPKDYFDASVRMNLFVLNIADMDYCILTGGVVKLCVYWRLFRLIFSTHQLSVALSYHT